MSIVIAVASMNRVVVKSDGRTLDFETNEAISEDYEHVLFLNDDCIIGYIGMIDDCEFVIKEYQRLAEESNIDLSTLKPTTVIYDLCELAKEINGEDSKVSFLVAGKENGRILLLGFTSADRFEINNFSPEDEEEIKYITLGSDIQKKAVQFPAYHRADKAIETTMNDYIRYIATIDAGVNNHIYTKKIKMNE